MKKLLMIFLVVFISFGSLAIFKSLNSKDNTSLNDSTQLTNKFVHFSFDDTMTCFSNLATNDYDSLFDEPFFNKLKTLHNEYGAKFSLYTYTTYLVNISDKYVDDFSANSDWLKIGFHSYSPGAVLTNTSYSNAKSYWNSFVENVIRVCGSTSSLDRMPRLETFSGSLSALKGLRDANYGALGFLSADDSRKSYYLSTSDVKSLYSEQDYIVDEDNNLTFIKTDFRCDWLLSNFSSNNNYLKPVKNSVYKELNYRFTSGNYNNLEYFVVFTHLGYVYDGNNILEYMAWVEDTCRFVNDYGYKFDFAQNYSFN